MARIVRLEIPADNPERAGKFYEQVFGWNFNRLEGQQPYWHCEAGPGNDISAGITQRSNPYQGLTSSIEVDSIEATIEKIVAAGGKVVAPKMTIPGIGYLAFVTDSEGNGLGIAQADKLAK